jgi:hypothetical protein
MNIGEVSCLLRPWHYMTVGWMVGEPRDQAVLSPDSRCVGGRCVMVKRKPYPLSESTPLCVSHDLADRANRFHRIHDTIRHFMFLKYCHLSVLWSYIPTMASA